MIRVFVEAGKKKVISGAIDWPGWARAGIDEPGSLQTLFAYAPRYAKILEQGNIKFTIPSDLLEIEVVNRNEGDVTTDFGGISVVLDSDREPMSVVEFEHLLGILKACWGTFDRTVLSTRGKELRKGSRGGGRDLEKMIDHINGADRAYLSRLAWKYKAVQGLPREEEVKQNRLAILEAVGSAMRDGLPEKGPRGGEIWSLRFFFRRITWHVTDHIWEIEDRLV